MFEPITSKSMLESYVPAAVRMLPPSRAQVAARLAVFCRENDTSLHDMVGKASKWNRAKVAKRDEFVRQALTAGNLTKDIAAVLGVTSQSVSRSSARTL